MIKKALFVFILIFSLFLCSCAQSRQSTQELLVDLLEISGEDFEDNGIFYFSDSEEGDVGYFSDWDKALMYGKDTAEYTFNKIESYAVFISSRIPGEIAVFKCYSASDTDDVERMCLERADGIKVALHNTEWREKTESISVTLHKRYVVFSFADNSRGIESKAKNLI